MINELTFGVELECYVADKDAVLTAINQAGVTAIVRGYSHDVSPYWTMTTDGSLMDSGVGHGIEIVSPILKGEDGLMQLRKVCNVLSSLKANITKKCGFHVHVGVANEKIEFFKNIYKLYSGFESTIDGIMPASRRNDDNYYCRSLKNNRMNYAAFDACNTLEDFRQLSHVNGYSNCRYFKINLEPWWRQGTIEFRHHSGTVNASKAVSWVMVCLKMVERAKKALPESMGYQKVETKRWVMPNKPYCRSWTVNRTVVDMLFREEGVTADEVNERLNKNGGWGSIGHIAQKLGIPVRVVQLGHKKRFFVEKHEVTEVQSISSNYDYSMENFISTLELGCLEASFIQDRTHELANVAE